MGNEDRKSAPSSRPEDNSGYADGNPRDREDANISRPKPRDERPEAGGPQRGPEESPGAADD